MTNFGVHYMRWALGKETPRAVTAMGGKFAVEDDRQIPDTMQALWDFRGTMMVFSVRQGLCRQLCPDPARQSYQSAGRDSTCVRGGGGV